MQCQPLLQHTCDKLKLLVSWGHTCFSIHAETWADKTEARYTPSQKPQNDRGGNTSLTAAAWTDPSTQSGE